MTAYVLMESQVGSTREDIIGVFSNPEKAYAGITEYYGENWEQLDFDDVRDSGVYWGRTISVDGENINLWLFDFEIDCV